MGLQIQGDLARDFRDYEEHHTSLANKLTHFVGIPMIVVCLLGLLRYAGVSVAGVRIDLAMLVCAGATLFYLRLDWRLGLPFAAVAALGYWLSGFISLTLLLAGFLVGWILQFVGHAVFEKKAPAFTTNLRHLLIGPLWIFSRFFGAK